MPGAMAPPEVLARPRDGVEGGGRAQVHDDARPPVEVIGADGVGDAIGADLLGVVVEDRHARAHAGLEHDTGHVEPPARHLAQRGRDAGHRRRHRHAGHHLVDVHAVEVEQLREQQGVLVGGALGDGRQPPVMGETGRLGRDGRRGAAPRGRVVAGAEREQADHRFGVPHVDGEQHGQSSTRSSPRSSTGAEWVMAPTEMRSAPAAA